MIEDGMLPEERFIRMVFPGVLSPERLETICWTDATRAALRRQIDAALAALSYRERGILEMRLGLGDGHIYTLAEAGYVFQLTRERIRQLQVRAVTKLGRRADDLRQFLVELNCR